MTAFPSTGTPFSSLVGEPSVRYLDPLTLFHPKEALDSRSRTVRSQSQICHGAIDVLTPRELSFPVAWSTFQGLLESKYSQRLLRTLLLAG